MGFVCSDSPDDLIVGRLNVSPAFYGQNMIKELNDGKEATTERSTSNKTT